MIEENIVIRRERLCEREKNIKRILHRTRCRHRFQRNNHEHSVECATEHIESWREKAHSQRRRLSRIPLSDHQANSSGV